MDSGSLSSTMPLSFEKLPNQVQAVMRDSYYIPSPTERDHIQAVLKHASDSTAGAILSGTGENMVQLCKSALSAFRRIPREILEAVILAWRSELEWGWNYYGSITTIMLVCRRWRDVVQSCQRLWSKLYINGQTARQGSKRLGCLMQTHKRFCAEYPWSVDIIELFENFPSRTEVLANLLLDTRDRWGHVVLAISEWTQILFTPPCRFPLLNRLYIYDMRHDSKVYLASSDVPVLRDVVLPYFEPSMVSLPWSQLTALMIEHIGERDLGHLIPQLANVGTLTLDLRWPVATGPSLTYEATHALRSLCLGFQSGGHIPLKTALQRIRIPHLQSLLLTRVEDAVFFGLEAFFSYSPHRSLVSLSLKVAYFDHFNAQNSADILSQLPNLQSLTLSTGMRLKTFEGSTIFLGHLQQLDEARGGELKLCPHLSSLTLNSLEFSDVTLGETLRIRRNSLRTLELGDCAMLRGDAGEECEKISDEHEMRDKLNLHCQDGQWPKISILTHHPDTW